MSLPLGTKISRRGIWWKRLVCAVRGHTWKYLGWEQYHEWCFHECEFCKTEIDGHVNFQTGRYP